MEKNCWSCGHEDGAGYLCGNCRQGLRDIADAIRRFGAALGEADDASLNGEGDLPRFAHVSVTMPN